jgi:peptidyl-prolyl cis-trans isomerase SurA
MKNFPYVNVIGKTIKAPECIDDVADKVLEDYQNHLEKEWVKKLRKKYKYTVYRKVLNKVSLD